MKLKRFSAFLMMLVMVAALCAGTVVPVAAETKTTSPQSIRILFIGDRYGEDCATYLFDLFNAQGYGDVRIGYMGAGATYGLAYYRNCAEKSKTFTFRKFNNTSKSESHSSKTLKYCIQEEAWDYVILSDGQSAPTDAPNVENITWMVDYVRQNCTNSSVQVAWAMQWALKDDIQNAETYATIAGNTNTQVRSLVDFVIPCGTAMANVATSFIGNGIIFDAGVWANQTGRLIVAHTVYSVLTGETLDALVWSDNFGPAIGASKHPAIVEAIRNAIQHPYQITQSTYSEQPAAVTLIVDGKEVACGGTPAGKVRIRAIEGRYRSFVRWEVVSGTATFDSKTAKDTYVTTGTEDVEIRGVYNIVKQHTQYSGDTGLRVGFSRVDVTPTISAPLAGYGSTMSRMSLGRLRPYDGVYLTAVALSDGQDTDYICTVDLIYAYTFYMQSARAEVSARTGVPADKIYIAGTHTHSAPDTGDSATALAAQGIKYHIHPGNWTPTSSNGGATYYAQFVNAFTQAIQEARADLAPVTRTMGHKSRVVGHNWIRHWRYGNGTMGGTNSTDDTQTKKGMPRDTDQEMQIVRFFRNDPKKDVVLVNFTGHATSASTSSSKYGDAAHYYMSADFPGYMRLHMEEQDGYCHVAFFQGALGCSVMSCNDAAQAILYKPSDRSDVKGQALGEIALDLMEDMFAMDDVADVQQLDTELLTFERLYSMVRPIQLGTVTAGKDFAIHFNSSEMFDVNAMDVKAASPFKITFVVSCAGSHEYIPSFETFRYDMLSTRAAYEARSAQCNVVPGTGEDMAESAIGTLNRLYRTAQ